MIKHNPPEMDEAEKVLAGMGIFMPHREIAKYKSQLQACWFTFGQLDLMKRLYGELNFTVEAKHSATFDDVDHMEWFVCMLEAQGYWIDGYSERKKAGNYFVDFRHQITDLDQAIIMSHVASLVELIEDLDGKYCNWELAYDFATKGIYKPTKQSERPIFGIDWHIYTHAYERYPTAVAPLFNDRLDLSYATDPFSELSFSILDIGRVEKAMKLLRKGKGKISIERLLHFSDDFADDVLEILTKNFYTKESSRFDLSGAALAQQRMGRNSIAKLLVLFAHERGEDVLGKAKERDTRCEQEVPFVLTCLREFEAQKLRDSLPISGRDIKKAVKL